MAHPQVARARRWPAMGERALYPGPGLDKFDQLNGSLWKEVYREGETVIYEVLN